MKTKLILSIPLVHYTLYVLSDGAQYYLQIATQKDNEYIIGDLEAITFHTYNILCDYAKHLFII